MDKKLRRILAIAPYSGMKGLIELTAELRGDVTADVYTGNLEEGARLAARLCAENRYDAVLSRGGTAELIARQVDVPVVDIPISAFDMLRLIQITRDYAGRTAIVGYESITGCASLLCELLQHDASIFTIANPDDLPALLQGLKEDGFSLIVGDTVTVPLAQQAGMNGVLLTSGRESINAAIDQLIKLCDVCEKEKRRRLLAESALEGMGLQAAILTPEGEPVYSSFSPGQYQALEPLMRRNLAAASRQCVRLAHTENGSVQILKGAPLEAGGQTCLLFHGGESRQWALPDVGITIRNRTETALNAFDTFYDKSPSMQQLVTAVRRCGETLLPILILGEIGTGKGSVASAVHADGPYRHNPFATVDCALMTPRRWHQLFESGQSPLTGSRLTVYFQSIQALKPEFYSQLIDYINNSQVQKRNRLLFSYACSMQDDIEAHPLCAFLKNKLGALILRLPPLRQRRAHIASLAGLYLSQLMQEGTKTVAGFTPGAMERLQGFSWKYNLDQFRQVLRELYILTDGPYISEKEVAYILDREEESAARTGIAIDDRRTLDEIERDILRRVLQDENGNHTSTARRLGISRSTLWRKLEM